jgi:hypothetical protein
METLKKHFKKAKLSIGTLIIFSLLLFPLQNLTFKLDFCYSSLTSKTGILYWQNRCVHLFEIVVFSSI